MKTKTILLITLLISASFTGQSLAADCALAGEEKKLKRAWTINTKDESKGIFGVWCSIVFDSKFRTKTEVKEFKEYCREALSNYSDCVSKKDKKTFMSEAKAAEFNPVKYHDPGARSYSISAEIRIPSVTEKKHLVATDS